MQHNRWGTGRETGRKGRDGKEEKRREGRKRRRERKGKEEVNERTYEMKWVIGIDLIAVFTMNSILVLHETTAPCVFPLMTTLPGCPRGGITILA